MSEHVSDHASAGKAASESDSEHDAFGHDTLRQLVHDLRNPLHVLSQATVLLERIDDLAAARSIHEMIDRQVREMAEILDNAHADRSEVPLKPDPPEAASNRAPTDSPSSGHPPLRIVVIEDQQANQFVVRSLLETIGHHVTVAQNGREGISLVAQTQPDVAIIDIGLPDIDGLEVARQIRSSGPAGPALIAITGLEETSDAEKSKAAGFDFHLVKPVDFRVLKQVLDQVSRDDES